ncbi:MAG TPA: AAC(3)-I family aminoglycoside N-acetyltransferase, partial [Hyphomicrobiaceae bacterium]|nr:AAC(3)-I family aminoglycoside N-acetyltransferase [Hyphomicrobiaceae bacterium]
GDAAAARGLNALFAEVFDDPANYASAAPSDGYLERLLGSTERVALVAEDDGLIIGALTAYRLDKFEQERAEYYIYDLAVAEGHRRQGIATALIRALQDIATQENGWVIFVQADYGDDPAIALYEKLGTREDVMHFDIQPQAST